MARLARLQVGDSGDELPDLDQVLGRCIGSIPETPSRPKRKEQQPSPRKQAREQDQKDAVSTILGDGVSKERETLEQARPQSVATRSKPLQPIEANILRYKEQANISLPGRKVSLETSVPRGFLGIRSSPKRVAKTPINYAWAATGVTDDESSATDDDEPFTDLSGFIVSDSESVHDYEDRSSHYSQTKKKSWQGGSHRKAPGKSRLPDQSSGTGRGLTDFIDLISPKRHVSDSQKSATSDEDGTRAEKQEKTKSDTLGGLEDHLAVLRFSPPRSKSPYKLTNSAHLVTPPSSPSKSTLQSPSKKARIPPTPHRPSIDAFWSQAVINDWNDAYSPRKTPKSTRRNHFVIRDSSSEGSPSLSPRKSPSKSPFKKSKADIVTRKAFDIAKHTVATTFLAEVDAAISNASVSALAAETGGIKLVWSKKLNSTAGRANWRREAIRRKHSDGSVSETTYRHHASIELAEKVIDNELRLVNVLAHEYCHLANFMISGIKDRPHGREFKEWARKCTNAFKGRGIEVTTKHTYEIEYKFMWLCEDEGCATKYQRHSRSIDPKRHACGKCKGRLRQIKPVPRSEGKDSGKRSEYQVFVKKEFERVKREMPGKGFGEIMAVLGREFRESKKGKNGAAAEENVLASVVEHVEVDDVLKGLDGLKLTTERIAIP